MAHPSQVLSVRTISPGEPRDLSRSATFVALILASAAETWTTSGVSLTLTDLTGTLSASSDQASWALTVYMAAFAISIALSDRLSLKFGNRRSLTVFSLLYALASVGCALSTDLSTFLVFRALAGFAGGAFLVRAFVFFTQQYESGVRPTPLVGYAIAYFFVGRFVSPVVCGWLADVASWRLLFVVPIILMLTAAWLFDRHGADHWAEEDSQEPLDSFGIGLVALGAVCLQTALSRGEVDGWFDSSTLFTFFLVGVTANAIFVLWQLSSWNRYPLLDFAILRNSLAPGGAILGFLVGVLLAGSLYVIPQYLRNLEVHSALQTGLLLSIGGASSVLVLCCFRSIIGLFAKIGGTSVLLFALSVEILSQLLFGHFVTTDTPDRDLWLPLVLNGIFVGLSVPTLGIVAFATVSNQAASNGRAMYYGCRQLGASVGVTLSAALIDRRMSLHSARLLDAYANRNLSVLGQASPLSERILSAMVRRQSSVLSFADTFYTMAFIAAITVFFVPLLSSPGTATSSAQTPLSQPDTDCVAASVGVSR